MIIPLKFIGLLMIGIVLSVYEGTMPGTLPTLFFSNVRYRRARLFPVSCTNHVATKGVVPPNTDTEMLNVQDSVINFIPIFKYG
jgi:hypothetical protein